MGQADRGVVGVIAWLQQLPSGSSDEQGRFPLLQLSVFLFRFFQDGNVGVGVFPESEEIFIGGERPDAGGIGIRSLRSSRLQSVRTSHSQMRQSSSPAVPDDAAMVGDLLKLGGGSIALSGCEVCFSTHV